VTIDVSGALPYESLSREALATRLSHEGLVLVVLPTSRARAAERLLAALELLRDHPRVNRLSRLQALGAMGQALPAIISAMLHPRLFEVAEFFILDKPSVWGAETVPGHGRLLRFQGRG
jgi:hypothetical protein